MSNTENGGAESGGGDHHEPLTLDLWITEDGWSVETVDGETLAGGRLSNSSQTRASLNAQLRESGYKIVEVNDGE